MSAWELRQCVQEDVRNTKRRRILTALDLNHPPSDENMAQDDISFHAYSQEFPAEVHRGSEQQIGNCVEVIDDDLAIIDKTVFDEAKKNSRRQVIHGLRDVLMEVVGLRNNLSDLATLYHKYRRTVDAIRDGDHSMNREASDKRKNPLRDLESAPTFSCPICMGPLNEPTTTKCGHIFCQNCIKAAIAAQGSKCPTCRQKLAKKGLIRVYLPAIN